jgi:PD-(D/E)XK nuclease superfamily
MSSGLDTNEALFRDLRREWEGTVPERNVEVAFARLIEEWREVEWRSGGRTLLAALGLQFKEVVLCRGLAWLLDPGGGHQMGRYPLHAFLQDLDVSVSDEAPVEIHVEETLSNTRADIVLRVGGQTVILEAKVFAGEQPEPRAGHRMDLRSPSAS